MKYIFHSCINFARMHLFWKKPRYAANGYFNHPWPLLNKEGKLVTATTFLPLLRGDQEGLQKYYGPAIVIKNDRVLVNDKFEGGRPGRILTFNH